MVDEVKKIESSKFDKDRMLNIMGLYAFMSKRADDARIAYVPSNNTVTDRVTKTGWLYTPAKAKFKTASESPTLADLYDMVLFIEAVLAEDDDLTLSERPLDFTAYTHKPSLEIQNLLPLFEKKKFDELTDPEKANLRILANGMLDKMTQYLDQNYITAKEVMGAATAENKKMYEKFVLLHAHVRNKIGSGVAVKEAGDSSTGSRIVLALRVLAVPLFPLYLIIGAAVSLVIKIPAVDKWIRSSDYTHPLHGLISGMHYRLGEAGEKYWAQARLDPPSTGDLFSRYFFNKVFGYASMIWVGASEFVGKSFFWPLKFIVGYDRMASDNPIRQLINGLENTVIGVLSAPAIVLNQFYRAVMDVMTKTIAAPENDTGLLAQEKRFKPLLNIKNTAKRDAGDWFFIFCFKLFRLLFDTIPAILTNTIVGSLRSILPAMPGISKKWRDNICDGLWYGVYGTTLALTGTFLVSVFLAGIGVSLPGGLLALFGASKGAGATALFNAYMSQIGGVVTTIAQGFFTFIIKPVITFVISNLNPLNLFSMGGIPGQVIHGIGTFFGSKWSTAAIVGTALGAIFGPGVLMFIGVKGYKAYQKENKNVNDERILVTDARIPLREKSIKDINVNTGNIQFDMKRKVVSAATAPVPVVGEVLTHPRKSDPGAT